MAKRTWKGRLIRIGWAVLILILAAILLTLYARVWAPARATYPTQGMTLSGDNGPVAWNRVAVGNADFAYLRATHGDRRDRSFAVNWAGAEKSGLRYGAMLEYVTCRPGEDQAALFIATVPRDNAALPPVVSLRFTPECADKPERAAMLEGLRVILNQIEAHVGKPAVIRVTKDFDAEYDIGSGINRTLWLEGNVFPPDYASRPWVMWTASHFRRVDGVSGPVDWNVVRP